MQHGHFHGLVNFNGELLKNYSSPAEIFFLYWDSKFYRASFTVGSFRQISEYPTAACRRYSAMHGRNLRTVCLSRSAESATEAISLALDSIPRETGVKRQKSPTVYVSVV